MIEKEEDMSGYTHAELLEINVAGLDLLADALESGEYQKGEGYLAQRGPGASWRMCCMGVGSEVAKMHGLALDEFVGEAWSGMEVKSYGDEGNISTFCSQVRDWFGLPSNSPDLPQDNGLWRCMGSWNDLGQKDFGREDPANAERDFTTIAAGVRKLAAMAREAQQEDK